MKKNIFLFSILVVLFSACKKDDNNTDPYAFAPVTIKMGAGTITDIYYSMNSGEAGNKLRSDWDIAFSVNLQTAAVLINEGAGVKLWSVGGSTQWETIDTTGILNRTSDLNDKSTWKNGAFNIKSDLNNVFNFGWGTYDHQGSYNVEGDSVYVIKLTNGDFKKFFIEKRDGYANKYFFKWADIDGTNEDIDSVAIGEYGTKNTLHYSIVSKDVVEYEPDIDAWDLLFTTYVERIPTGPFSFIDQLVMGVLTSEGTQVAKVEGIAPNEAEPSDAADGYQDATNAIGYDWKVFDHSSGYQITEDLSYFIKTTEGSVYQIYFTAYGGQTDGTVELQSRKVE